MRVVRAGLVATLLVLPVGCSEDVEPEWNTAALPDPGGTPGFITVRDAVNCGGVWTAVGGVVLAEPTETQDSRPAAWRSTDGVEWTTLDVTATTYWGERALLTSIACANDEVVAVGARSGGAHGNPRVTTFFEQDGGLHDQEAAFNLYGGATATNVGPLAAADPGWLITGNRVSGPAVWHSEDGRDFTIEEDVTGLADAEDFVSLAQGAVWDGDAWVVVGGGNERSTLDREPVAWMSEDARSWQQVEVPGSDGYDDLERVIAVDDELVALGLSGDAFGVWRREDGDWSQSDPFGILPNDARRSPFVSSLVGGDRGLWATTSDGTAYALWHSNDGDGWTSVPTPERAPETGGEHVLTVAASGDRVLLISDDGTGGRLWWSTE